MSAHSIDKLAGAVARGGTRRRFLASVGAAVGLTIVSRIPVEAGGTCATDLDCDAGMICSQSFCLFPECTPSGGACSPDLLCCDGDHRCIGGICAQSPSCRLLNESCGAGSECCPGMVCSGGICAIEQPAPPENTGGNGNSGGGGGGNGEGGGAPSGGSAGGGGTTSGGVVVASLPSTGVGVNREKRWGVAVATLAGAAGILGLGRRSQSAEHDAGSES